MNKQLLLALISMLVLSGLIFTAKFAYENLRGVGPAFEPAPGDIGDIIDRANESGNMTEMSLTLSPGFSISVYARNLDGPRVMLWAPDGRLYVSQTKAGTIVALRDDDGDGKAEEQTMVLSGLNRPHGMASRCTDDGCVLYIAEATGVFMYDYNDRNEILRSSRKKVLDIPNTLTDTHFTRSLLFRPYPNDTELLVSVGSSCNVCRARDERYASIIALHVLTGESRIFARGLRNAVFMSTQPVTGATWATEMGRDMLGDDIPPDEINIIDGPSQGSGQNSEPNFGWPICYGKNVHDTEFDKNTYIRKPCTEPFEAPSHIDVPAHSAPLGIAFVPEEGWPEDWWHNAIVAYHGSWNRSTPTGYKLVRYKLDAQGKYLGEEDFVSGWLTPDGALGRPVDIIIQPGGTMFVSDDKAGVVYRLTYSPSGSATRPVLDMIRVTSPEPNDFIESPLVVTGEARGLWYFEASFPVELLDAKGKQLAVGIAQAKSDWMTKEFVRFSAPLAFTAPPGGVGTLVLRKDNPSGLPEHDDELRVPVRFEPPSASGGDGDRMSPCRAGGCSGQLCTDRGDITTTCEWREEYACYRTAICERQANGACGWRNTPELHECLANPPELQ